MSTNDETAVLHEVAQDAALPPEAVMPPPRSRRRRKRKASSVPHGLEAIQELAVGQEAAPGQEPTESAPEPASVRVPAESVSESAPEPSAGQEAVPAPPKLLSLPVSPKLLALSAPLKLLALPVMPKFLALPALPRLLVLLGPPLLPAKLLAPLWPPDVLEPPGPSLRPRPGRSLLRGVVSVFCHFGLMSLISFVTEPWCSCHVLFVCECAASSVLEPCTLSSVCLVLLTLSQVSR